MTVVAYARNMEPWSLLGNTPRFFLESAEPPLPPSEEGEGKGLPRLLPTIVLDLREIIY